MKTLFSLNNEDKKNKKTFLLKIRQGFLSSLKIKNTWLLTLTVGTKCSNNASITSWFERIREQLDPAMYQIFSTKIPRLNISTLVGNSNDPPRKYCILDVIKRLINQSRLVKTGRNWSKLVETGRNWLKLVQTGQNCQNWLKLVMAFLVQRPTGPLSEHFGT